MDSQRLTPAARYWYTTTSASPNGAVRTLKSPYYTGSAFCLVIFGVGSPGTHEMGRPPQAAQIATKLKQGYSSTAVFNSSGMESLSKPNSLSKALDSPSKALRSSASISSLNRSRVYRPSSKWTPLVNSK